MQHRWFLRGVSAVLMLCGAVVHGKAGPCAIASKPDPVAAPGTGQDDGDEATVAEQGVASWYGRPWRGRMTASGRRFDDRAATAAHLWLPFATKAHVTNLDNGRSIDVLVVDRGPYHAGRIIDLSARAAQMLGMLKAGTALVSVTAQVAPDAVLPVATQ